MITENLVFWRPPGGELIPGTTLFKQPLRRVVLFSLPGPPLAEIYRLAVG
jgi:hypothetical protein